MAIKILTKNGIENTNVDGARSNNFNAGQRSGIVKGVLNEGLLFSPASNAISLDSCELRVYGHRVVIDAAETFTFTNIPSSNQRQSMVAEISVDSSYNVAFRLFIQSATTSLTKDNLDKTGVGVYQLEIGKFTHTTAGLVEDIVRTADVITGGTGASSGNYINIGEVTTTTLSQGSQADVDIENVEVGGQMQTNFNFAIPSASGTTVSVNGVEQANISFKSDPQTQINQISNPNLLINGDFRVNQRGKSVYSFSTLSAYTRTYTVDRWRFVNQVSNSGSTITVNTNSISIYCASQYDNLAEIIEDYDKFTGKTVTLSVNVKSLSNTGFVARIMNGTDQIAYMSLDSVGIKSVSATLPNTLGSNFRVDILLAEGYTKTIEVEWIKLEIGSMATLFSPRPYAEELTLCQRYYEKIDVSNNANKYNIYKTARNTNHFYDGQVKFMATKRTPPTVTLYSTYGTAGKLRNSTQSNAEQDFSTSYITADSFVLTNTNGDMVANDNIIGYYSADSEIY